MEDFVWLKCLIVLSRSLLDQTGREIKMQSLMHSAGVMFHWGAWKVV
jgi:hypothetical protein